MVKLCTNIKIIGTLIVNNICDSHSIFLKLKKLCVIHVDHVGYLNFIQIFRERERERERGERERERRERERDPERERDRQKEREISQLK